MLPLSLSHDRFFFKGGKRRELERLLQLRNVPRKEAHVTRVAYMRFIIMLQRVRCVTDSVVIILITGGP